MQRALEQLDQLRDAVDLEALAKAEIERCDREGSGGLAFLRLEAGAQRVVDDRAKRPSGGAGCALQAGRHVVVKGQGRSHGHIMKCR